MYIPPYPITPAWPTHPYPSLFLCNIHGSKQFGLRPPAIGAHASVASRRILRQAVWIQLHIRFIKCHAL